MQTFPEPPRCGLLDLFPHLLNGYSASLSDAQELLESEVLKSSNAEEMPTIGYKEGKTKHNNNN